MEIKRERVTEPNGNDYIKVTVGDRSRLFDIGNEAGIEAWAERMAFLAEKPGEWDVSEGVPFQHPCPPEIVTTPSEPKKAAKGKKSA